MATLAGESDQLEAGLRALLQGRLSESQRRLNAARKQAEECENSDPVIAALGLAFSPSVESLISVLKSLSGRP